VAERGYKNVAWFRDGIPSWVQAGYPLDTSKALPKIDIPSVTADQLRDMLADIYLLDIREVNDVGTIEGTHSINIDDLSSKFMELPKAKKIVIMDHSGKQSIAAARYLKTKGFDEVSMLQGGIMSWINQGYSVKR
jgi:rhodanese-related sulfurtransferase